MKKILTAISLCVLQCQLQAQVSFKLSATLGVGNNVNSVVAADVNGDGKLDLISGDYGSSTLTVLTNDGSGRFVTASTISVGTQPISVTAADLNGDGKLDLISANNGANTLSILTNDGSGGFALASTPGPVNQPWSVKAADVNGDGHLELISADAGDNTISVMTNNGSGGFVTAGTYAVGAHPSSVAAADFTGGGKLDLVSANFFDGTLSVLTNNENGGFVAAGTYAVGSSPICVAVADVNGDGKLDLISANYGGNSLSVLTNNGGGAFVTAGTFTVGNVPRAVVVADVNGDGKQDLISANNVDNTISVLTNNGSGGFVLAFSTGVGNGPQFITAADLNGDGKADLITANVNNTLSVLTNATPFPPSGPPVITTQPASQTNAVGGTAVFGVGVAVTAGPLWYQWRFLGTNLPAATNSLLGLTNLTLSQAGYYDVVISNYVGSITSSPALLDVRFILVEVNGQLAAGTATASAPATLTILGGYPGGFLFYTLDGSTPTTGSEFYTGPITLTNSVVVRTLAMSADFSQSVELAPVIVQINPTYNLQTSVIGSGTISTNPPGGLYASNSVVILTASAASRWAFDHWTGDATGSQNPLSVTMNGPRNVQAVFVQTSYPLTLTTPGGGGVTANGLVIAPTTYYPTGSLVSIAATANSGWSFLRWQGSVSGTNNPLSLTMNATNIIQAIFGTVVSTNSVGGGVVLGLPNPIPYGTILSVSAVPDPGNCFVSWTGNVSGTNAPTRITVTSANPTIGALFTTLPVGKLILTVVVNGTGFVTNNPPRSYYSSGDLVTSKAFTTNNSGVFFLGWSRDATGTNNPLTLSMTNNKVIQANFGIATTVNISPLNLTVLAGSNAVLSANALGLPPLSYQWQNSQGTISGATNTVLTISNIQPTNAGGYFVVVTNTSGSVTSAVATVTIVGFPTITNQPAAQAVVTSGHAASFVVGANGWPTLAYQWQLNGENVIGATNAALALPNAFPANAGTYAVAITNIYGSVTSNPALLTVLPLDIMAPVKLANGQFQFGFDTAAGVSYEVQYSTNLADWYPWLTIGGSGVPLTLTDPNIAGSTQRYYRIFLSPQ